MHVAARAPSNESIIKSTAVRLGGRWGRGAVKGTERICELSALGEQVGESLCGCWTVKQLPETVTLTKMDGTAAPDVGVTLSPLQQN